MGRRAEAVLDRQLLRGAASLLGLVVAVQLVLVGVCGLEMREAVSATALWLLGTFVGKRRWIL